MIGGPSPKRPPRRGPVRSRHRLLTLIAMAVVPFAAAGAAPLTILHADSLAGLMRSLKTTFEAQHPGVAITLVSGVSRDPPS